MPRLPLRVREWTRFSLRTKFLLALAMILLPSLVLVLAADFSGIAQRRADIIASDQTTAETVASLVDASIDDAVAVGKAIATAPSTLTFNPSLLDARLRLLAGEYPQFDNIVIVNREGQSVGEVVAYAPGQLRISVADRPYFRDTLALDVVQVSPIVIGRHVQRPTAVISVPVRDSRGTPVGAVLVALNLNYFQTKLASVSLSEGRVIVVTDPIGQLAYSSYAPRVGPSIQNLSGDPLIAKAIQGVPATQQAGAFPGLSGSQLGVAVGSPQYHWIVAVLQPTAVAEASLRRAVVVDVASFFLALIIGVLATLYLAHRIIGPILALDRAASAWTRGDLGVRVSIHTGDELERLGSSLDVMAASLSRTLTQLSESDRSLMQERNRLRGILETSPAGIVMIDSVGRIVFANRTAEVLLGTRFVPQSIASRYPFVHRFFRPNAVPYLVDQLPIFRALHEGITIPGEEVIFRRPNGYEVHLLTSAAPVREANGQIIGAVALFTDVTPIAEEERLRREFVASAAHEFRHPLTVIKGYAEVAMRNPKVQGTTVCHDLSMIVEAADRANRLADELLKSAGLRLPLVILHFEAVDLARLARETVDRFEKSLPVGVSYRFVVQTTPAEVDGDPKLLSEALTDLLRQAADAMPGGGEIDVSVTAWDGIATVSVTDHGPPVPAEAIPFLFRPFGVVPALATQAEVSRPSLLLYIAKRIVEESGGWIRATSSAAGTTISFSLPRQVRTTRRTTPPDSNGRPEIAPPVSEPASEERPVGPGGV